MISCYSFHFMLSFIHGTFLGLDYVGQKLCFPLQSSAATQGVDRLRLYQQSDYGSRCQATITHFGQGPGELHRHDVDRRYRHVPDSSLASSSTGIAHSSGRLLGSYFCTPTRRSLALRFRVGPLGTKPTHTRFSSK